MAISDKLNYLIETKQLFKDRLNSLGAEIIESTTFRNYLNWLDTFYGETSDKTDLSINGVVGRTSQESTTGKNLLGLTDGTYSQNGITAIVSDGEITLNGTATANSFIDIPVVKNYSFTNGDKYTISLNNAVLNAQVSFRITLVGTYDTRADNINRTNTITYDSSVTIYGSKVTIRTGSETTLSNFKLKPQIELGSTATSYEPYTGGNPSPNPDFPQEINNLSGDVEYKVRGKNLFDKSNANVLNAYFAQEKIIASSSAGKTLYISCKPNTTYTVSRIAGTRFRVLTTETTPTLNANGIDYQANDNTTSLTITTSNNANYLCVYYYSSASDTKTEQQILDTIQVEQNDHATPYEPYISRIFPINLKSKNLFDKDNANIIKCGISYNKINASDSNRLLYISIQPNTTYTIQRRNDGNVNRFRAGTCSIVPANGVDLDNAIETDNAESITITSRENDTYLAVMYYRTQETILTEQQILDSIQIKKVDNLFDINGISTSYNAITTIENNKLIQQNRSAGGYSRSMWKIDNLIIGENYTLSCNYINNNSSSLRLNIYNSTNETSIVSSEVVTNTSGMFEITFTATETSHYLRFYSNTTSTANTYFVTFENIQLEKSSNTGYEPYYDIQLCNISDYKDRIYSQNGKFYLEKKTGKVVLDGSESVSRATTRISEIYRFAITGPTDMKKTADDLPKPAGLVISNRFIEVSNGTSYNNSVSINGILVRVNNTNTFLINCIETQTYTVEQFKTWLSTHNTEVQYVLATPTTTEITQENYPTLYSQLLAIQEFLTKYKINKEFLLDYSSPEIEY